MAKDVERLVLELSADVSRLERGMRQGQATAERRTRAIEKSFDQMQRNSSRSIDGVSNSLKGLAATLATGLSVQAITRLADGYTRFTNQLKVAGLEGQALAGTQEALFGIAQRYGVELEAIGTLYGRNAASAKELNLSTADQLKLTTAVAAALKIQGGSAEAASGALLQLSQVLGGSKVQAEEYNSLLDGLRPLLQGIASASDKYKGSVAALTADVKSGNVQVTEFARLILASSESLQGRATSATLTFGGALTQLNNALGRYIGQTDQSLSATQRAAQAIGFLADNLDTIIPALAVLASLIGGRYLLSLTAATSATLVASAESIRYQLALVGLEARQLGVSRANVLATASTRAFTAALAANPIGAVLVVVTALAAGLFLLSERYSSAAVAARELDAVTSAADVAIGEYAAAVQNATNKTGKEREELLKTAAALREVTAARINDARVNAQKRIDEAVASRREAQRLEQAAAARQRGQGSRRFSEASLAQDVGANQRARGASSVAGRDRQEANEAIQSLARLERAFKSAETVVTGGGGGGGGAAGSGGGAAGAISHAATQADDLREQLSKIQDDLLTDAERAAKELAEKTATIRAAVQRGYLTGQQGARLEAAVAGQDLQGFDPVDIQPLEDAGRAMGEALAEGFASRQQDFDDKGRELAASFVDIVRSGNIGENIGYAFRDAAMDGLEDFLSKIASAFFAGQGGQVQGGGGNWMTTAANALGNFFGGKRALGGPVQAGKAYQVNENTGRSEFFVPKQNGWVGNLKAPKAVARGQQNITVRNEYHLEGAAGTEAILSTVARMQAASQRQTIQLIKAGAPSAQLEQQLLRD